MTHRRRKHLLVAANVALVATIGTCLWVAAFCPPDLAGAGASTDDPTSGSAALGEAEDDTLAGYAVIYGRPLRKPLFDPKPVMIAKPKAPEPKFTAVLTGTIVEPGFTRAFFRTRPGQDQVLAVGQKIDGADILEIIDGSATVNFHGKQLTLKVEGGGT